MSSIVPFPLAKSDGAVKEVVAALAGLDGRAADAYWRRLIKAKRLGMSAQGVSQAEADDILLAFGQEVFLTLARRYLPNEGDAA
ncbi:MULTISPECIES: DUF6074 family protein [unclassified Mesorhizobium]|uniref:DUF6074 family protein n=1 Tax=unclassified Mesorhizobium TaxID=325217 RepID=UPI0003D04658|nr:MULTISPECIES: DUF6074 family protein [unclassified Mesorhizobium]ESZ07164.1 hypothetical protein X736_10945 [Mesorhizobium sp. L2C089B000]WJI52556.1 DUF6074 family protein [Mesorhizobium sp. C089B]